MASSKYSKATRTRQNDERDKGKKKKKKKKKKKRRYNIKIEKCQMSRKGKSVHTPAAGRVV